MTTPTKVTPETLTDEEINAELKACRGDEAQARSMIQECVNALYGLRSGRARIAHAINARRGQP